MRVAIFPPSGYEGEKFYQPVENDWHVLHIELRRQLEEAGYQVIVYPCEVDVKADTGIYFEHQLIVPLTDRSILVMIEPPVVRPRQYEVVTGLPYTRIFTHVQNICDQKRIFFSPVPVPSYDKDLSHIKRDKHLCAITGFVPHDWPAYNHPEALYAQREWIYRSFGKQLDLYGHRWHLWEYINEVNYLGVVADKIAKLAEYKNAIVFENWEGFASEKIYHCVMAGTRPIYRGNREAVLPLREVTEKPWAARIVNAVRELT